MNYKKTFLFLLLLPIYSQAQCFDKVGKFYNFDPDYLRAIAWKESRFNSNAIGKNNDGSMDIGIMQINTSKNLLKYPCFNISVGGYILNENFKRYGRKWLAVGVYNAGSKNNGKRIVIRYNYAKDVNKYYNQIKNRSLILPRVS